MARNQAKLDGKMPADFTSSIFRSQGRWIPWCGWSRRGMARFGRPAATCCCPVKDCVPGRTMIRPENHDIWDICAMDEGGLWVLVDGGNVYLLDAKTGKMPLAIPGQSGQWRNITPARTGGLWVRDGQCIRRWQGDGWVEDRGVMDLQVNENIVIHESRIRHVDDWHLRTGRVVGGIGRTSAQTGSFQRTFSRSGLVSLRGSGEEPMGRHGSWAESPLPPRGKNGYTGRQLAKPGDLHHHPGDRRRFLGGN